MGRYGRTVYPTKAYRDARVRCLAGNPLCVHCKRRPGVEADHQPPLSCHVHVEGSGCCRLVPSCARCGRRQGAHLVNARPYRRRSMTAPATPADTAEVADVAGYDAADPVWDVAWLDGLRDVPPNAVWPRLMSAPHPHAVDSYGAQASAYAAQRCGEPLRWWQQLWMARLLEHDDDGRLVWDEAVVTLARQLGKSWALRELAMWRLQQSALFGQSQDIVHTAKDVAICREVQRAGRIWAMQYPKTYKVRLVNGQEEIERLADGSRWMVRAKHAVYGLAASLAIVDEGWAVPTEPVEEGLIPTMAARRSHQLLLVSTAHRLATPLIITRRTTALADLTGTDVLLVEWSAPGDAAVDDVAAWHAASPHWDGERERLVTKRLATTRAGETVDASEADPTAAFRAQWLNIWPARAPDQGPGDPLVPSGLWEACEGTLDTAAAGWVALDNDDKTGAAVAFVAGDGHRFEIDGRAKQTWGEAVDLARAFIAVRPGSGLIVGANLRATIKEAWPERGENFHIAGTRELPTGLPLFRSLVVAGRIVHDRTADLDRQVANARVRATANGTLGFASFHRKDLLKAAIWALQKAYMPPPAPAIH